jgi:hypothetical protein
VQNAYSYCARRRTNRHYRLRRKKKLLETIKPQYIILKPALVGGFSGSDEWISIAENLESTGGLLALESNIGLNAICQYTYIKKIFYHKDWEQAHFLPIILKQT